MQYFSETLKSLAGLLHAELLSPKVIDACNAPSPNPQENAFSWHSSLSSSPITFGCLLPVTAGCHDTSLAHKRTRSRPAATLNHSLRSLQDSASTHLSSALFELQSVLKKVFLSKL